MFVECVQWKTKRCYQVTEVAFRYLTLAKFRLKYLRVRMISIT
jgi:hypothetical protein